MNDKIMNEAEKLDLKRIEDDTVDAMLMMQLIAKKTD